MKIESLPNHIGALITDCQLSHLTKADLDQIYDVYIKNPVLVIRQTDVDILSFAKICARIGHIANEPFDPLSYSGPPEKIPHQRVTGITQYGQPTGIFGQGRLDWHCNMNGPTRAAGVGLLAVSGVEGSITSWMSTIPAYRDLDEAMKKRLENLIGHFQYSPDSWAPGMHPWQRDGMNAVAQKDGPYKLPLVQKALNGEKGMYFHFLNGCHFPDDPEIFDFLKSYLFQPQYVYDHHWQPGDIVLSNQIVTLHKRQTDDVSNRLLYRYTFQHPKNTGPRLDVTQSY